MPREYLCAEPKQCEPAVARGSGSSTSDTPFALPSRAMPTCLLCAASDTLDIAHAGSLCSWSTGGWRILRTGEQLK